MKDGIMAREYGRRVRRWQKKDERQNNGVGRGKGAQRRIEMIEAQRGRETKAKAEEGNRKEEKRKIQRGKGKVKRGHI